MKHYTVFLGNYGSGKTELSINTALALSKKGQVALVDMDIVNPYFRSSEHGLLLQEHGVRVIAPPYANTAVDVPALGAEVYAAFEQDYAVFDAGGDPVGATALGAYKRYFDQIKGDLSVYYVVNARRPFQKDMNEARAMLAQIEGSARLKIDGLVNNTNLARETTADDLVFGYDYCRKLGEYTGLPIAFSSGTKEVLASYQKMGGQGKTVELQIFTRPDWLDAIE